MTHYMFSPSPTFGLGDHPFVTWNEGFTLQELENIVKLCDSVPLAPAVLSDLKVDSSYRRSDVAWINAVQENMWLFDRLAFIMRQLNGQFYQFDMHGFCEPGQYTVYSDYEQSMYDWHTDSGSSTSHPRKLSLVMQLSDPSEYEGGELQLMTSRDPIVVDKKFGLISVFPSYVLHRVTPVTKGTRKSLVLWACGPKFR